MFYPFLSSCHMKLPSFFIAFALFFACCSTIHAQSKEEKQTVYAFGYATCLGDSAIYLSVIQPLPNAQLQAKTDFLQNRHDYAVQMEQSLYALYGKHFTCAVFYGKDAKKLEKQYAKVCHQIEKEEEHVLQKIPLTTFQFSVISNQTSVSH